MDVVFVITYATPMEITARSSPAPESITQYLLNENLLKSTESPMMKAAATRALTKVDTELFEKTRNQRITVAIREISPYGARIQAFSFTYEYCVRSVAMKLHTAMARVSAKSFGSRYAAKFQSRNFSKNNHKTPMINTTVPFKKKTRKTEEDPRLTAF